jgi:hypothetical protein
MSADAKKRAKPLNAFGLWMAAQPRGALSRAQLFTGLAYSTVHYAQTELVTKEVAKLLSRFTGGEVPVSQIAKPERVRARGRLRRAEASK